jgi:phage terminase large subunit
MQPIKYTEVFDDNALAFTEGFRYIINQGSARSSKTFSILQLLYKIANKEKARVISVVSQTLPHLKRGAIRDFLDYLISTGQYDDKAWNRSNMTYTVKNSIIEFFSVDQPDKVYGAARDILFCNEVNSINEEAFRQLAIRTRETIFTDYNPTHEFYMNTDYMLRDNAKYIHSTFKKNPYLSDEIIKELVEAGKRNPNFQKVFVEGEVGEIEGTVFNNWEIGEFDKDLQFAYGQDYGFSSDPTTLIKIAIDKKNRIIYAHECFYLKGLSTNQIYRLNNQHANNSLIVGDSAEPRLIKELKELGNNIMPCEKGQGSVSAGLLAMQDYKIILTPTSHNLHKEFRNYVWLDSGSKLVIDDFNHGIDSIRYIFQILMKGKRTTDPQKIADMFY